MNSPHDLPRCVDLLLDFDEPTPPGVFIERCIHVAENLGLRFTDIDLQRSSNGGTHMRLRLETPVDPVIAVCLQALLGSDYKRETFNLVRVLGLANAPTFWHSRWNVLYSQKLGRTADMIDRDSLGKAPLKADDIPGDATVLTVADVEQTTFRPSPGEAAKPKIAITFAEFPDNVYYANVTGVRNLCDKLGNDEQQWVGKRVPLVKTQAPDPRRPGTVVTSLWVAGLAVWDSIVAKADRKPAAKSTAKRGAQ